MQAHTPLRWGARVAPCLVALALPLATSAAAQSLPGVWDGAYWGLSLALVGQGEDRVAVSSTPGDFGSLSMRGGLGAVQAGYMSHKGAFVWGFEGDLQLGHVSDSFTNAPFTASTSVDMAASLRLLAGVPTSRSGLLFVTGGLAAAQIDYAVTSTDGLNITDSSFHTGYALGAGYEQALRSGWSARIEYHYTNYGKTTLADGPVTTEQTPDYHLLRIGMNHRF
ncbi:MAG: outer membrane beta-barrel protein [Rhodobacteraceae bacterium]|nr:outer membrane beta-barrel protein [Paracoccaceae bacterium]